MAPEGWGPGPSRELKKEEFAQSGGTDYSGPSEGYKLEDQSQFAQRVVTEHKSLQSGQKNQLFEIAKFAGIMDKETEKIVDTSDDFDTDDLDFDDIDVRV